MPTLNVRHSKRCSGHSTMVNSDLSLLVSRYRWRGSDETSARYFTDVVVEFRNGP